MTLELWAEMQSQYVIYEERFPNSAQPIRVFRWNEFPGENFNSDWESGRYVEGSYTDGSSYATTDGQELTMTLLEMFSHLHPACFQQMVMPPIMVLSLNGFWHYGIQPGY
jgi:hypothetical protein